MSAFCFNNFHVQNVIEEKEKNWWEGWEIWIKRMKVERRRGNIIAAWFSFLIFTQFISQKKIQTSINLFKILGFSILYVYGREWIRHKSAGLVLRYGPEKVEWVDQIKFFFICSMAYLDPYLLYDEVFWLDFDPFLEKIIKFHSNPLKPQ